jgi:hypothetical protein
MIRTILNIESRGFESLENYVVFFFVRMFFLFLKRQEFFFPIFTLNKKKSPTDPKKSRKYQLAFYKINWFWDTCNKGLLIPKRCLLK